MAIGAKTSRASRRYAKAIFSWAGDGPENLESVLFELGKFLSLVQSNESIYLALTNPAFPAAKRLQLVSDFADRIELGSNSKRVLLVIAEADRLSALSEIIHQVEELRLKAANLIPVHVETPADLSAEEQRKVVSRFGVIFGRPVKPTFSVNPGLIGGLRAVANGKTYDGSIFGWLSNFQERSAGGA